MHFQYTRYGIAKLKADDGLIAKGSINFSDIDTLTVEKQADEITIVTPPYNYTIHPDNLFLLAVQKDPYIPYDLIVSTYNLIKIDDINVVNTLHTIYTVESLFNSITGELIGTGDGSKKTFNKTLTKVPVCKTSVSISYTIGGTAYTATDNGKGTISGTNCSGTINYDTGEVSLTFTTAPDNGTNINANYKQGLYTYRDYLIQGLFVGEGKIKLGFRFSGGVGSTTIYYKLYRL